MHPSMLRPRSIDHHRLNGGWSHRWTGLLVVGLAVSLAGCLDRGGLEETDGGSTDSGPGTGGRSATGGRSGSGGITGSGGHAATGGTVGGGGSAGGRGGSGGGLGGSGGGFGGSGGSGARGGSGGGGGTGGATMCSPTCDIFCPYGRVLDSSGCPTCSCKPKPVCVGVACLIACPYGYVKDINGCDTCSCNPGPICPAISCGVFCPNGYVKDAKGCETCACNLQPQACTAAECGPVPAEPITLVCPTTAATSDGSGADVAAFAFPVPVAPPLTCQRTTEGKCVWQRLGCRACDAVTCTLACVNGFQNGADGCPVCACNPPPPPATCGVLADSARCASNPQCTWLQPGCTQPALAAAGCYARASLGCTSDADCGQGHQCLKRVINPCPTASSTAIVAVCTACGLVQTICQ